MLHQNRCRWPSDVRLLFMWPDPEYQAADFDSPQVYTQQKYVFTEEYTHVHQHIYEEFVSKTWYRPFHILSTNCYANYIKMGVN